jgi:hypothetical protein
MTSSFFNPMATAETKAIGSINYLGGSEETGFILEMLKFSCPSRSRLYTRYNWNREGKRKEKKILR